MTQVVDLGFKPRHWQAECFRRLKRFSVIVVHRRGGKTLLAVMRLIDAALKTKADLARYAYVAPELKQAKAVAWDYIKSYARKIPGATINESELWVQFPHNKARIRIYGADNPDSLRGLYFDGAVMDEVAQMKPEVWGEVIRPTLADRSGWVLFIGTPKGINMFSELYFLAISNPSWFAISYTCADTNALAQTELDEMREQMTENQWRQEMLCDFTASSDESLISLDMVNAAMGKHLSEDKYTFAAKVIGVDVARQGGDRTVLQPRQGLASFKPIIMRGADSMEVAARVVRAIDTWHPDAVFIDGSGGYGAGVIDRCRQLGHDVIEIQFGGKPTDHRFVNKRTEMWWGMREWLRAGGVLANLPEYRVDLTSPSYDHGNAAGKLALESKDDIQSRGLPSPDLGDALALTFAHPVLPRGMNIHIPTEQSERANNPIGRTLRR